MALPPPPVLSDAELDLREQVALEFAEDPAYYFEFALQVPTLQCAPSPLVVGGLWQGEREFLALLPRAIAEQKEIYVASGHALGKDFIAGGLPLWFQETRYPAKTILTGPTARQVHEITWNELQRHAARRTPTLPPIGGHVVQGKWEWDAEHFILAFTIADSQQHIGKAQGFHAPHLCVIVTEAQAVPDKVKEQVDGLLASGQTLFIAIGNPLVTTGWFAKGLRDTTRNLVLHLDCEQSPNVLEGREIIPGLCSKGWVEKARQRWQADDPNHPLWLAKVKGQLPSYSVDTIFDRALIERSWTYRLTDEGRCVSLGVDVAEFGDDESAFCVLADGVVRQSLRTAKHEPTETAGRSALFRKQHGATAVVVDRLGVGAGVASMLRELQEDGRWVVVPFTASEKPTDDSPAKPSQYGNQRAQAYFYAREQLQLGTVQAPKDQDTVDELCETKYYVNSKGRIFLEKKEEIKERLGRSPDGADAWVMAVWGRQHVLRTVESTSSEGLYATVADEVAATGGYSFT